MSEAQYDAEIAPLLLEAAKRCEALGLPMVAVVEYAPDQRGETRVLNGSSLPMLMLSMIAHHGMNVDGFLINLIRHCNEQGIDIRSSTFLKSYAKERP
jgi:hypothetical protein